jgi:xanthine/CO dehydrogenase XdhC/CoxF family maturation factor
MHELTQLITLYETSQSAGQAAVLATVVNTSGSTYRRPGARLLLAPNGDTAGMVSGGCLEQDVLERAKQVLASDEPLLVTYDGASADDLVWGLGCNGVVQVLIERIESQQVPHLTFIADCLRRRRVGVLATVFSVTEQSPVPLGARLMLTADGTLQTDITEPQSVQAVAEDARNVLLTGQGKHASYPMTTGNIEVFLELIQPPTPLVIFGAGPDAFPLVRLAKTLGWDVTVVDHRPAFAKAKRFPVADRVILSEPGAIPSAVALDGQTVAVVMTHHYLHDRTLLGVLLAASVRYVGVLGPKARTVRLLDELRATGVVPSPEVLHRLYGPVGLDIGAETPEQVALAIVAEIQAVLANRTGGLLRERKGPIHETWPRSLASALEQPATPFP